MCHNVPYKKNSGQINNQCTRCTKLKNIKIESLENSFKISNKNVVTQFGAILNTNCLLFEWRGLEAGIVGGRMMSNGCVPGRTRRASRMTRDSWKINGRFPEARGRAVVCFGVFIARLSTAVPGIIQGRNWRSLISGFV